MERRTRRRSGLQPWQGSSSCRRYQDEASGRKRWFHRARSLMFFEGDPGWSLDVRDDGSLRILYRKAGEAFDGIPRSSFGPRLVFALAPNPI